MGIAMTYIAAAIAGGSVALGAYLWIRVRAWDAPVLVLLMAFWVAVIAWAALGHPRPMSLSGVQGGEVIAYELREGSAIYVWLRADEPVAYAIPWSLKAAKRLVQAAREAERNGTGVILQKRGKDGPEADYVFHAAPIPTLPPKDGSGGL